VGFLGGCLEKKPTGFFWVRTRVSEPLFAAVGKLQLPVPPSFFNTRRYWMGLMTAAGERERFDAWLTID